MAAIEFFWDPVCPFAWVTSRWVNEVARQRPLEVRWRPISLRLLNEGRYDDPELVEKKEGHQFGLALLRMATAVEADHGNDAMARIYTALGSAIFLSGDRGSVVAAGAGPAATRALTACELPAELAEAVDDESLDATIWSSSEEALQRVGGDLGTPILTFGPPDGPSFFGPVISRVPRGAEASDLWDAVEIVARHPSFSELKRARREPPQVTS